MNIFLNAMVSWKTTFLGIAGVIAVVAKWVQAVAIDWSDMPAIMTALGLVVAKDANVIGAVR